MSPVPTCDLYLRLSDARVEEALDGREIRLRAEAARLGWTVHRVVVENDVTKDGRVRPASAWKRRKIRTPSGRVELRTVRPGFRNEILEDITTGRVNAMLAEDLDRVVRDPRDLEDLLDACDMRKASARSLSGSLTLTEGGTDSEKFTARIMVATANKSSADTARRVADKKETLWGVSYCGGPRPYGYVPAQDAEKYRKTLLVVPDEAEVLRAAASDILNGDVSLAAVARDLRERGVPTAKGDTEWSYVTLKKVLLKPAIAGLAARKGALKPAPWEPIIEPDTWERLRDKLNDPARRSGDGNEPKWLLSGTGLCGVCQDGTTVRATGARGRTFYTCREGYHLKRNAARADAFIEQLTIARLSQPDVRDILKPPVRQGIDVGKLRAEVKDLQRRKAGQMKLHSAGVIDDADLATGMRDIRDRLAVAEAQLAACTEADPLAEFRDKPAETVWKGLSLPRKRAVVRLLADVTFLPATRRGPGFDPDSVAVAFRA